MKVNLLLDNPKTLNGYLNIDPFLKEAGTSRIKSDVFNLDEYIDNAECEEIRASEILCYVNSNLVDDVISNWIKKIRINGTLVISEIDFVKVYSAYEEGLIDLTEANILLYGNQEKFWDFKKCIFTLDYMNNFLIQKELKIIEKYYEDAFTFTIKAKR